MSKPFLSVVIPSYNEEKNFNKGKLDQVYDYLSKQKYLFELLLVDDGSTDATLNLLETFAQGKAQVKVLSESHRGKGATVKAGMLAATGTNKLFTDFDQSTPIGEVDKLLMFWDKDYDVVIGSREVKGARRDAEPWYRHLMGRVFNYIVRLFTIGGIMDTQCGFKLFSEAATNYLFNNLKVSVSDKEITKPFFSAFDVELLFLANKKGYLIAEVPVAWTHVETTRLNTMGNSIKMFWQVVMIRWAALRGVYNK